MTFHKTFCLCEAAAVFCRNVAWSGRLTNHSPNKRQQVYVTVKLKTCRLVWTPQNNVYYKNNGIPYIIVPVMNNINSIHDMDVFNLKNIICSNERKNQKIQIQ